MDDAEIVVNIILKTTGFCCNDCCECCRYVMYPISATRIENDTAYNIKYECEYCEETVVLKWNYVVNHKMLMHEFDRDRDEFITFSFDKLSEYILKSKGKFNTIKALLNIFNIDYESKGYTIPKIYDNLKKFYGVGHNLHDCILWVLINKRTYTH